MNRLAQRTQQQQDIARAHQVYFFFFFFLLLLLNYFFRQRFKNYNEWKRNEPIFNFKFNLLKLRLKQKLRGQNYFFDQMGNVVVVRKAGVEKLPNFRFLKNLFKFLYFYSYEPRVNIRDPAVEAAALEKKKRRKPQKISQSSEEDKTRFLVHVFVCLICSNNNIISIIIT